ncbi:MAG: hypothetical protein Q9220_001040 [cf. Caloplaca sp. 1 TL-2023]
MTATTALTVQNTQGVYGIHYIPSAFVSQQIDACFDDIGVDVIKIGASLGTLGPQHVLLKGGHVPLDHDLNVPQEVSGREFVVDILQSGGNRGAQVFLTDFSHSKNTHAAIASNLALGHAVNAAVENACRFVEAGIHFSKPLGKGNGPINHFHSLSMAEKPPGFESSMRKLEFPNG